MKRPDQLTTGSIPKTLMLFALPILLGNVLQSVNGSINAVWIGKFLGAAALTGANNANIVMFLLLGAVFGITMASTILIAQAVGAQQPEEAKRITGTSATFFFVLSLAFSLGGFFASPYILAWMGAPADAVVFGTAYLRVMFVALPASYAFFFINAALRGAGDSKTPFRFLVLSVVLDVALNPLFIFGLGPIPAMGIAGSALATLVSQCVALAAILRHVYKIRHPLAIHVGEGAMLKIDWSIIRSLVIKGIPMGLQMILLYLSETYSIGIVLPAGSPALEIAIHVNHIILWSFPLFGISMVLSGVVRAAGAVMVPLVILVIALLVVRAPLAEYSVTHWGADGVWWSFSISAITAAVLSVLYYLRGSWRSAKMRVPAAA